MKTLTDKGKKELIRILNSIREDGLNEKYFFEYFLSYMKDYIFMFDAEQHFIYVNNPSGNNLLYKPENFLGKKIEEIMPEDVILKFKTAFNTNKKGQFSEYEYKLANNNKIYRFSARMSPVFNNREFLGSVAVVSDITEDYNNDIKLKRSEKLLKESAEIAKLGYWELDIPNNVLIWSDEIFRMFEISSENFEAHYDAFLNTIHPEDREKVNNAYMNSLENKTDYEIEHRLLLNKGIIKYVREKCKTVYDTEGSPIRSIGTVQDITTEKETELNLKKQYEEYMALNEEYKTANEQLINSKETAEEKEKLFRDIFNTVSDPMSISTISEGEYLFINKEFADLTGYPEKEVIGKSVKDLNIWKNIKDRERFLDKIKKNGFVRNFEAEFRIKNGRIICGLISANYIKMQGIKCLLIITRDIDEIKKMQKELRNGEYKFKSLFNNLTEAIYLHPLPKKDYGNFIEVNDGACRMLGYTKDEFYKMSVNDINISEDILDKRSEEGRKIFLENDEYVFETEHIKKSGERIPVEIKSVIFDYFEEKAILSIVRDITQKKEAEKKLLKYQNDLEELVKERTEKLETANKELIESNKELEKFNDLFVGRELRIKELKNKIERLEKL